MGDALPASARAAGGGAIDAGLRLPAPGAEQAIRTDRIEKGVHGRCARRDAAEEQAGAIRDVPGVGCGEERDEGSSVPPQPLAPRCSHTACRLAAAPGTRAGTFRRTGASEACLPRDRKTTAG